MINALIYSIKKLLGLQFNIIRKYYVKLFSFFMLVQLFIIYLYFFIFIK